MTGRTLIAGIGNVFLGDDGFGVEVASRLAAAELPAGVRVVDYGIRGMHLAYDLAGGYDTAILVDATPRGEAPGTIYVIEPELPSGAGPPGTVGATTAPTAAPGGAATPPVTAAVAAMTATTSTADNPFFDAHGMQPDVVFGMLDMLDGGRPGRILVVGCEPASVDYGMGLSTPVAAAVDEAVRVVLRLVATEPDPASQKLASQKLADQRTSTKGRAHVSRHSR